MSKSPTKKEIDSTEPKEEVNSNEPLYMKWRKFKGRIPAETDAEREYDRLYKIIMTTRQPCSDRVCKPCEKEDYGDLVHCEHCWHCDHCLQYTEVQDSCQCPWYNRNANDILDLYYDELPSDRGTLLHSLTHVKFQHGSLENHAAGWENVMKSMEDQVKSIELARDTKL